MPPFFSALSITWRIRPVCCPHKAHIWCAHCTNNRSSPLPAVSGAEDVEGGAGRAPRSSCEE